MYVLINLDKKSVYGFSSHRPNMEDLKSINRTAVEYTGEMDYSSLRPVFEDDEVVGVEEKTMYDISASKKQIDADEEETAYVEVKVDEGDEDKVQFIVNEDNVGTVYTEDGVTELEFTADTPGIYTVKAESVNKRYISNSIDIEVI